MGTTYNGVNSAQGGNIFKDVKFWVAQRVPLRSAFIDDIKVRHLILSRATANNSAKWRFSGTSREAGGHADSGP